MIKSDRFWIVASSDFYDMKKSAEVVYVTWNRSSYYAGAHMTLTEIVNSGNDNINVTCGFYREGNAKGQFIEH
jgi:hypothetical protein